MAKCTKVTDIIDTSENVKAELKEGTTREPGEGGGPDRGGGGEGTQGAPSWRTTPEQRGKAIIDEAMDPIREIKREADTAMPSQKRKLADEIAAHYADAGEKPMTSEKALLQNQLKNPDVQSYINNLPTSDYSKLREEVRETFGGPSARMFEQTYKNTRFNSLEDGLRTLNKETGLDTSNLETTVKNLRDLDRSSSEGLLTRSDLDRMDQIESYIKTKGDKDLALERTVEIDRQLETETNDIVRVNLQQEKTNLNGAYGNELFGGDLGKAKDVLYTYSDSLPQATANKLKDSIAANKANPVLTAQAEREAEMVKNYDFSRITPKTAKAEWNALAGEAGESKHVAAKIFQENYDAVLDDIASTHGWGKEPNQAEKLFIDAAERGELKATPENTVTAMSILAKSNDSSLGRIKNLFETVGAMDPQAAISMSKGSRFGTPGKIAGTPIQAWKNIPGGKFTKAAVGTGVLGLVGIGLWGWVGQTWEFYQQMMQFPTFNFDQQDARAYAGILAGEHGALATWYKFTDLWTKYIHNNFDQPFGVGYLLKMAFGGWDMNISDANLKFIKTQVTGPLSERGLLYQDKNGIWQTRSNEELIEYFKANPTALFKNPGSVVGEFVEKIYGNRTITMPDGTTIKESDAILYYYSKVGKPDGTKLLFNEYSKAGSDLGNKFSAWDKDPAISSQVVSAGRSAVQRITGGGTTPATEPTLTTMAAPTPTTTLPTAVVGAPTPVTTPTGAPANAGKAVGATPMLDAMAAEMGTRGGVYNPTSNEKEIMRGQTRDADGYLAIFTIRDKTGQSIEDLINDPVLGAEAKTSLAHAIQKDGVAAVAAKTGHTNDPESLVKLVNTDDQQMVTNQIMQGGYGASTINGLPYNLRQNYIATAANAGKSADEIASEAGPGVTAQYILGQAPAEVKTNLSLDYLNDHPDKIKEFTAGENFAIGKAWIEEQLEGNRDADTLSTKTKGAMTPGEIINAAPDYMKTDLVSNHLDKHPEELKQYERSYGTATESWADSKIDDPSKLAAQAASLGVSAQDLYNAASDQKQAEVRNYYDDIKNATSADLKTVSSYGSYITWTDSITGTSHSMTVKSGGAMVDPVTGKPTYVTENTKYGGDKYNPAQLNEEGYVKLITSEAYLKADDATKQRMTKEYYENKNNWIQPAVSSSSSSSSGGSGSGSGSGSKSSSTTATVTTQTLLVNCNVNDADVSTVDDDDVTTKVGKVGVSITLTKGKHTIEVSKEGYRPTRKVVELGSYPVTTSVTITAVTPGGELMQSILINSNATGAEIYIVDADNQMTRVGTVGIVFTLEPGSYKILLTKLGYDDETKVIEVTSYPVTTTMNMSKSKPPTTSISKFITSLGGIHKLSTTAYLYLYCNYMYRKTTDSDWKTLGNKFNVAATLPTTILSDEVLYVYYLVTGDTISATELVNQGRVEMDVV